MFFEKLSKVDLNLLLTLHLLLEEKSVTRAAQRLCLSQSAVSKNLAKLREQFNDPLFTRTAYGLQPKLVTFKVNYRHCSAILKP